MVSRLRSSPGCGMGAQARSRSCSKGCVISRSTSLRTTAWLAGCQREPFWSSPDAPMLPTPHTRPLRCRLIRLLIWKTVDSASLCTPFRQRLTACRGGVEGQVSILTGINIAPPTRASTPAPVLRLRLRHMFFSIAKALSSSILDIPLSGVEMCGFEVSPLPVAPRPLAWRRGERGHRRRATHDIQ